MARQARVEGNEGKARVCARRAAGFAAEAFFQQQGLKPPTATAYHLLELLSSYSALPEEIERSLHLLTLRVNADHNLPQEADLIQEAKKIIHAMFPDEDLDLSPDGSYD